MAIVQINRINPALYGFSGYSGASGASGQSGYSGVSGSNGSSGYSGVSGSSGNSGYSGTSGSIGSSGYSGTSGISGYSGYSSSSRSDCLTKTITQNNHGFLIGNVVRWDNISNAFILAIADSESNSEVVGIVDSLSGSNSFSLLVNGYISSLSGLSSGQIYYLSDSVSGLMTISEPIAENTVSKPLLIATSTNEGYFFNFRGQVNGGTLTYSIVDTLTASSVSLDQYREVVLCDASSGSMVVNLPDTASYVGKYYTIKKIDRSGNTISVSGASGQHIDGNSVIVINTQYDAFSLVSDGSNWFIT